MRDDELTEEELAGLEDLPDAALDATYEFWLAGEQYAIADWCGDEPSRDVLASQGSDGGRWSFEEFHEANADVWQLFEQFCLEMIDAGQTRFGAPVIWERMRWETRIQKTNDGPYRLPNQHRPYYARMFQEKHPELAHHIATRPLKSEADKRRTTR